ncbi:Fibroblast growth factor receptor-like protein 2 [Hypsibius exemplaris]|uniref:Fibroblast growth factor receptor-like protein 2 n=1 Tax=Hypsibius exemplaris TaxID=2072580 RepID=A0A1W0XBR9_HYPEX|nr:Fibroblast growth factor receptor-like protein 2 [Hypsibius exemplaris]
MLRIDLCLGLHAVLAAILLDNSAAKGDGSDDGASSVLKSGQGLMTGQSLISPRRNIQLYVQSDGISLQRLCDGKFVWGIRIARVNDTVLPLAAVMQKDGKLGLYNAKKVLLWESGTEGGPFAGAELRINNDGTICIAKKGYRCLWSTGGYGDCDPVYSPTFGEAAVALQPGQSLNRNETVFSRNGTCNLTVQPDGNVVVYRKCDGALIYSLWKEGLEFKTKEPASGLGISANGNLEIRRGDGRIDEYRGVSKRQRWDTSDGADLRLGDDCILCVYKNGACLWTSSGMTYGCPLVDQQIDRTNEPLLLATRNQSNISRELQVVESGDALFAGDSLWSPSRNVHLKSVSSGDWVIYRQCDKRPIWSSGTSTFTTSKTPPSMVMQENGNLAIYGADQRLLWSSGTFTPRFAGAKLRLDDTGSLCIYTVKECLWKSGAYALCRPEPSPTFEKADVILQSGMSLMAGKSISSNEGSCSLAVRPDGNVILTRRCDGAAVFSVRHGIGFTENLGTDENSQVVGLELTRSGDLTLTDRNYRKHTFKNVSSRFDATSIAADLRLREDCGMCIFKGGACLWTAHALTYPCPPGVAVTDVQTKSDTIVGAVVGTMLSFLLLIFLGLVCYRRRLQKSARRSALMYKPKRAVANTYSLELGFAGENELLKAVCSEYVALLEIPKAQLELSDLILGKGEFGIVYKGLAHNLPTMSRSPTTVAAKMLTGSAEAQRLQFAGEVGIMLKCGRHVNIVNILGIVRQGRPYLLLEYCANGSLLSFLKERRSSFYSHLDEMKNCGPIDHAEMEEQWTLLCQSRAWDLDTEKMADNMVSTEELIKFSHQISRGMAYLTSRFIIHRDLAARNILVTDGRVMKISDFGLARHGVETYTVSNAFIALPILWMPPDAIRDRKFSEKSDVWSFGVLLWEIFSLGLVPFDSPEVTKFSAAAFADYLSEGHQPVRPANAPNAIVGVMESCWCLKPQLRPTFTELWKSLDEILSKTGSGTSYMQLEATESNRRLDELDRQILDCLEQNRENKNQAVETDYDTEAEM